jgi:small nuclear ribonucleoprotein (snRNP)-like protein
MSDLEKFFLENVINRIVKITLDDGRVVYGTLHCIDKQKNMVLVEAIQEMDQQFVAPVNESLNFYVKNENKSQKYIEYPESVKNDENLLKQVDREFWRNKFYVGQVIVPGKNIKKLEIQSK